MKKYLDKLKKLIALAEGAGSESEAQNALARVAEIQAKYNIESSAIEAAGKKFIAGTRIDIMRVRKEGTMWEWKLAIAVAHYHLGSPVLQKHMKRIWFIGKDMNVEVCIYMFEAARTILRNIVSKKFAEYKKQILEDHPDDTFMELYRMQIAVGREVFISSWLAGAVQGLNYKFSQQRQEIKKASSEMKAVIVANDAELDEYVASLGMEIAKTHSNNACGEAARDGFDTGSKLQLNAGVQGDKASDMLSKEIVKRIEK